MAVVTLYLWTVPAARVPDLVARTTAWRLGRQAPAFAKLLGTTRTGRFDLPAADPHRWLLLASWPDPAGAARFGRGPLAAAWRATATEAWSAALVPLSAHGRWAGRQPFPPAGTGEPVGGPVLVLTRARLRWRRAARFWRAMARVPAHHPGLRLAFGVGEAPIGWQGTVSVWDSPAAADGFAYRSGPHLDALRAARRERWYAEELFARFAIDASDGTVDGRDPLR